MKKLFTLAFMALFVSIASFADVSLGNPSFTLKENGKIRPANLIDGEGIILTFPNATEVETFVVAGKLEAEGQEALEFDGLEGTYLAGCQITGFEDIKEKTAYTLTINSVKVNDVEMLTDTVYTLHFTTRSTERIMSWTFTIDEESSAKVVADADGEAKYWSYVKAGDSSRFYSVKRTNEPLMLDDATEMPMTEELTFTFGGSKLYVGNAANNKYQKLIAFNANGMGLTVPDCKKGDVITFNANRATKASSSKFTTIWCNNSNALAPDGAESSRGVKDSIQLGSSYANFKFEVQNDGDVSFTLSNCLLASINIAEAKEKVPCKYSVNAVYNAGDGTDPIVLKNLVAETSAMTGTTVKVPYSYWLTDENGNLYTYGTKGSEFTTTFDLEGDTTFVINYKSADKSNVVYLSEGEDIEGALECTHANAAIRSSNCKAAYVEADTKLVTLEPGTYKASAIIFDANKTASYVAKLKVGEEEFYLPASATNWTEVESQLITVEAATDVYLEAGGSDTQGLDVIAIYNSTDAPDPEVYFNVKDTVVLAAGDSITYELQYESVWEDGAISYKSSDTAVATVDATGEVKGVAEGVAIITGTYKYNSGKSSVAASYPVKVTPGEATAIKNVNADSKTMKTKKLISNGRLVIETANGTFTPAGAQLK